MTERRFKQLDRNGDGYLNSDEMPNSLRAELNRWDTNKDGLIDLTEYKAYAKERELQRQAQSFQGQVDGANSTPEPDEDRKPVVYNSSNYPKELPAWFKQLDIDNDGQVGLYEWRRAGKSIEEFQAMDRNDDGFLTIEEVLYSVALAKKADKSAGTQVASFSPGNGPDMGNGFQMGGQQRFGKGGRGQKGSGGQGAPQVGGQQRFGGARPQIGGNDSGDNANGGIGNKAGGRKGSGRKGAGGQGGGGQGQGGG